MADMLIVSAMSYCISDPLYRTVSDESLYYNSLYML